MALSVAALSLPACDPPREVASSADTATPASARPAAVATGTVAVSEVDGRPRLPPLRGDWLEKVDVAGFAPARVSLPLGATEPRPVLIGAHGRGDRPEWACGEWRGITDAYPFILCPHGSPVSAPANAGLAYPDWTSLAREVALGLAALRARYGAHVAEGPVVWAGFSLGAHHGARIAQADGVAWPLLALAEGGTSSWTRESATRFAAAAGPGARVLFACSTSACDQAVAPAARLLEAAGVTTRAISAGNIGHLVDDRVIAAVKPGFAWLVEGQRRWQPAGAPPR